LNAFAAASFGAAYSCFMEKTTGALKPGMKADFVVLDLEWTAEKLLEARVVETWFGGKKVYAAS
jgi:predicted amidohydrolase YtcJ